MDVPPQPRKTDSERQMKRLYQQSHFQAGKLADVRQTLNSMRCGMTATGVQLYITHIFKNVPYIMHMVLTKQHFLPLCKQCIQLNQYNVIAVI